VAISYTISEDVATNRSSDPGTRAWHELPGGFRGARTARPRRRGGQGLPLC